MRRFGRWLPCVAAAAFILAAGVSAIAATTAPAQDFPISTPEEQGVDSAKLADMCDRLNSGSNDIRAVLIIRNGKLIFERYEQHLTGEENLYTYSVTKSFTSTLAGIAIDKKLMRINEPIVNALGDVPLEKPADARKRRITLRNLLMMQSGFQWTDNEVTAPDPGTDFARMQAARDRVRYVWNQPMAAEPGTKFLYSNGDAQLAAGLVARQVKQPLWQFARDNLFDKLGFKNWEWNGADATGLNPGGTALRLRPKDMCKLGVLFLNNGKWNGEQIVSASWVAAATSDLTKTGYGYFWWTNINAAGHTSYSAIGLKGQYVRVIPDLRLVISMNSVHVIKDKNQEFNQLVNQYIIPAAKSAQPLKLNPGANASLTASIERAKQIERKPGADWDRVDPPHPPKDSSPPPS